MSSPGLTTSAALYFDGVSAVPSEWFVNVRRFFAEQELQPILFTADGGGFVPDDCFLFDDAGRDLRIWGEVIPARAKELETAIQAGELLSLTLDVPSENGSDREDWTACASFAPEGVFYLGAEAHLLSNPVDALRRAIDIVAGAFEIRYGIAYQRNLADFPSGYAHGFVNTTFEELRAMIRNRGAWNSRQKRPDELWCDEIIGPKRHLVGLFRGAYPANILSEVHVQAADLRAHPIGTLSAIDTQLWLWELTPTEVPVAEAMLEAKKLLVRQVSDG
jgi:hypothetical protein